MYRTQFKNILLAKIIRVSQHYSLKVDYHKCNYILKVPNELEFFHLHIEYGSTGCGVFKRGYSFHILEVENQDYPNSKV